jgi:hypothetical protein
MSFTKSTKDIRITFLRLFELQTADSLTEWCIPLAFLSWITQLHWCPFSIHLPMLCTMVGTHYIRWIDFEYGAGLYAAVRLWSANFYVRFPYPEGNHPLASARSPL